MSNRHTFIRCCLALILVTLLFITQDTGAILKASENENKEAIKITFYYNNPCGACNDEEIYEEVAATGLEGIRDQYPYDIWILNSFQTTGKEQLQKDMERLGIEETPELPIMILEDHVVSGLEDMKAQISFLFLEEVQKRVQPRKVTFFSTYACDDCERVKQYFEKNKIQNDEYSINEEKNAELIYEYFNEYNVSEEDQQVPIVFMGDWYLSGADAIIKGLSDKMSDEVNENETDVTGKDESSPRITLKDSGKVILTGLVNGVNPCSVSMLLFLLSLFVVSGRSMLKVGFAYLTGRFFAYMSMGLGLFSLGSFLKESMMSGILDLLQWVFFALAVILAILNLLDFIHAKRQEYGKIRLQLPKGLRHWNHERIKKVQTIPAKWLIPVVFLLGLVISAGEFFCTGQLYSAVILSMIQTKIYLLQAVLLLCIYVLAMCIPHAVFILIVSKSQNLIKASNAGLQQMPVVKLINAIIFIGFAVWILSGM